MFKSVIEKADLPYGYGQQGMNTERWMQLPRTMVYFHDLIATQDGILFYGILQEPASQSGDPTPHVVKYKNRLYLEDGHHRAVWAAVNGAIGMYMRVLDLDA